MYLHAFEKSFINSASNIDVTIISNYLDDQNNIVDTQYYKAIGFLDTNIDESVYIETEITIAQEVIIPNQDINESYKNKLLIGFMLDQEKLKILN